MGGETRPELRGSMYRRKQGNTKVGTVEKRYGVDLNARSDMTLGNLLRDRGFASQSQLLKAYRGQSTAHARARRIFLSFHYEDRAQVNGFRLLAFNPGTPIEFYDGSVREAVDSERSTYVKNIIAEKIRRSSVVVCLIGDGTAGRDWVEWELETALEMGKGICGVRLKGARGRAPEILRAAGAPVVHWDLEEIISAIECAAARRS